MLSVLCLRFLHSYLEINIYRVVSFLTIVLHSIVGIRVLLFNSSSVEA